jgi:hypothetical protein
VAANSGIARNGTIAVADQIFTVTQAAFACTYTISPTSENFTAAGGNGAVTVTTTSNCTWTAVSSVSWITVTGGASGTGTGVVAYAVQPNTGNNPRNNNPRNGSLTIAGRTFNVSEEKRKN